MTVVKRILFLLSILVLGACHGGGSPSSGPGGAASTGTTGSTITTVSTVVTASSLSNVPLNSSIPVTVAFRLPNGGSATALTVTTGLASLPSGWSVASPSFSCASVNAENPCNLTLTYGPTTAGASGTLTLGFTYADSQGKQQQGSTSIPYSSAAANSVTTSVAPSGPVQGVVGLTDTVSVTFQSGAGTAVSNLALVTDPGSLPSGWSVQGSALPCATVTGPGGCQLQLAYAPTAAVASGTLTLGFSYADDSGAARTGSVAIDYSAVTPAAVTAAATPASASPTYVGSAAAVDVAFSATVGAATNLQITSALPIGWTLAGGILPCAQIGGGSTCQVMLNYAPVAPTSASTLELQYTYTDNFGEFRTGQVSIPYSAVSHMAYITNVDSNTVTQCALSVTGALGNCTQVSSPMFNAPAGITIDGARAYIAEVFASSVSVCNVDSSGLSGCKVAVTGQDEPASVALDGDIAFISNVGTGNVKTCNVATDGTFSGCVTAATATPFLSSAITMTFHGSTLYIVNSTSSDITLCGVTVGGISACVNEGLPASGWKVVFNGTSAYVTARALNSVQQCSVGSGGTLTACSDSGAGPIFHSPNGITLFGGYAYILNQFTDTISQCAVAANGQLSGCVSSTGNGLNNPFDIAIQ